MLEKKIQKAIEEDLPKQVGEVLSKRLKEGRQAEIEIVNLGLQVTRLKEKEIILMADISKLEKLETQSKSLTTRENNIFIREQELETAILKIKLEEANRRADMVMSFTGSLMRNTIARKSILDSENQVPYQDSQGIMVYPSAINKSFEETKEDE